MHGFKFMNIYSYNFVMCIILYISVYLREKFQENETTFGPDFFGGGFFVH